MQWGNDNISDLYIHINIYNYILVHSLFCISADDASRVILSVPDTDGSDYINASFIDVCR